MKLIVFVLTAFNLFACFCPLCGQQPPDQADSAARVRSALRGALVREAALPGKPAWRPMLLCLAGLHGRSVQPPIGHLPYAFESIGPGYQKGSAFGHIDLTHQRLDTVRALPDHVRNQIRNELAGQQEDGLIPGVNASREAGRFPARNTSGTTRCLPWSPCGGNQLACRRLNRIVKSRHNTVEPSEAKWATAARCFRERTRGQPIRRKHDTPLVVSAILSDCREQKPILCNLTD